MKPIKLILLGVLLTAAVHAQNSSKLTVPGSPAFSILDFEPSSVMKPTNVKALAGDVLNSFDKEGKLLMNLGLEFSPYWLGSHPNLTRDKYLNPSSLGEVVLRSLRLSAATVKDSATSTNRFGTGLRFKLLNGRPSKDYEKYSNALKDSTTIVAIINGIRGIGLEKRDEAIKAIEDALIAAQLKAPEINSVKNLANSKKSKFTDSPEDVRKFLDELIRARVEQYALLAAQKSDALYNPTGLIIELAGAASFNTNAGDNSTNKIGIWANATYAFGASDLLTFTARFMDQHDNAYQDTVMRNADAGLAYVKKTSKFNMSLEAMARWYRAEFTGVGNAKENEKDFTYRVAFQGSYLLTKDISINLSLGKEFDSPYVTGNGFFSIFGLNYSIFSKRVEELEKE